MRLEDFIDSEENEEQAAADEATGSEGSETAEDVEALETGDQEQPAEEAPKTEDGEASAKADESTEEADEPDRWQELVTEYGGEDEVKEVLDFHTKYIAGEDDNQAVVEFAKEMNAISPERYGLFVEMIVNKYAPNYGFAKAEAEEPEEAEFDDDDYETDREKALAEENAQLKARLAREVQDDQQTVEEQREEAFTATVGQSIHEMVAELGLHEEIAADALKEVCGEVAATKEFKVALKAVQTDDGNRAKSLTQSVQNVAAKIIQANSEKYSRRSNAQKAYEENTKPTQPVDKQPLETVSAAHVQTEITDKRPMPPRGSPLSAYA